MDTNFLYENVLGMLTIIKDDEKKLMEVMNCLENQVLGENKPLKIEDLSPEYRSTIMQIAESLYNGYICYLNPDTLEIEQVEQNTYFDNDDYSEQNDDLLDEFGLNHMKWGEYIKFEPPGPNELLRMMEKYVSQMNDSKLGSRLVSALDDMSPVSSFLKSISESDHCDEWMEYRRQETIKYVNDILMNRLRNISIKDEQLQY